MAQKQKPVGEISLGRIRAKIWANVTDKGGQWFNVSVSRLYKDGDQWKEATTFSRDDLPIAAKALDMAYAWIWDQERTQSQVEVEE